VRSPNAEQAIKRKALLALGVRQKWIAASKSKELTKANRPYWRMTMAAESVAALKNHKIAAEKLSNFETNNRLQMR
jgi:hypothetical protein